MKIVSEALSHIGGVDIYPIISLIIFFSFFVTMIIYVLAQRKSEMQKMERYVLEETDQWEDDKHQTGIH